MAGVRDPRHHRGSLAITCTEADPLGKDVMQYRILGRTGVSVSSLSLGTMLFGGATGQEDAATMLDLAVAAGINSVDTANVYGRGASEELLGQLLAGRPGLRDRLVLASKVHAPMADDDPNAAGSSRRHIIDQCNASLRRLGVDYLDLYYLHRPSTQTPIDESLRALDDLVRAGKIRYLGTSSFAAWQLMESLWAAKEHGLNRVVAEQSPYSLVDRRVERELLPMARSYGIGVTVWSPLANGLLTGKYHEGHSPDGARLARGRDSDWDTKHFGPGPDAVVAAVTALAREKGCTPAQLSLAWLLSREGIASVIIGARTSSQLRDLIDATSVSLSAEDLKLLDTAAAPGRATVPYYLDDSFADFRPHRHRW
jgi:aryl-alcohol dehydrogenase-like predicted oxidoreductase